MARKCGIKFSAVKFFDQFKQKYDPNEHPCISAMKFFRPQLQEWKIHDEFRLSVFGKTESSFGWGSIQQLGIFLTFDHRPILAYASAGGEGSSYGSISRQIQAESLTESFTFIINSNERADVYYNNYPIGFITPDLTAFDLKGVVVMRVHPTYVGNFRNEISCFAPAHFHFASGINGGYNIPPHYSHPLNRDSLVERYAMGIPRGTNIHDYERRWMMAMWIFLRLGPWSSELFPTAFFEDFDWTGFLPLPFDNMD